MMKQERILVPIVLLFYFLCCHFLESRVSAGEEPTAQNVTFKWAFLASIGSESSKKLVPITKDTILHSGDNLKMMVEMQSKCHVYVLFKTSNGEILKLFPRDEHGSANSARNHGQRFYLPEKDSWYTLDDNTGIEKVYLLASFNRLYDLEMLIDKYAVSTEEKKEKLATEIVESIKKLRNQHKRFTASAERPEQIGGTVRGTDKKQSSSGNIDMFAMTISGDMFFAKTFTIEHR